MAVVLADSDRQTFFCAGIYRLQIDCAAPSVLGHLPLFMDEWLLCVQTRVALLVHRHIVVRPSTDKFERSFRKDSGSSVQQRYQNQSKLTLGAAVTDGALDGAMAERCCACFAVYYSSLRVGVRVGAGPRSVPGRGQPPPGRPTTLSEPRLTGLDRIRSVPSSTAPTGGAVLQAPPVPKRGIARGLWSCGIECHATRIMPRCARRTAAPTEKAFVVDHVALLHVETPNTETLILIESIDVARSPAVTRLSFGPGVPSYAWIGWAGQRRLT
ncbi:hypothetical protein PCL_08417 [Purpureocillium lilacinum]|uniref:Uncharacterized protein n=1 Tax=Purpureocillium lilacinum TaxID=33203 RepID=A0A2U3DRT8_PURLI|nr:hypothetical protein PCL_08417 [Purpureocillium lilacinum]